MAEYIEREKIGLTDFEIAMCNGDYKEGMKMLLDKIASIPAADVRPVVHGEWLRTPTFWAYCSVCGEEPPKETNITTNYCPNCGARMEGET